jgi:hypothetical protein
MKNRRTKKIGIHIPVMSLTSDKLISAIAEMQTEGIKNNVLAIGQQIRNENGLDNALNEIEKYIKLQQS